jgi:flagellar hook-basal body complex protein FliE
MTSPISSLLGVTATAAPAKLQTLSQTEKGNGFGSALADAIQGVDQTQKQAEGSIQDFLQGKGELHNVALATQRAEMTFDLGLQIRNKVVSAYQEIMKMQL